MFADRFDAAKQLAQALSDYSGRNKVVILGIPRGGVEIGHIVAKELKATLASGTLRIKGYIGYRSRF